MNINTINKCNNIVRKKCSYFRMKSSVLITDIVYKAHLYRKISDTGVAIFFSFCKTKIYKMGITRFFVCY